MCCAGISPTANAPPPTPREVEKINRFADELNAEMKDVLAHQSLDHLWEER